MTANDFENAKAATTAAFALLMVSKVETGLYLRQFMSTALNLSRWNFWNVVMYFIRIKCSSRSPRAQYPLLKYVRFNEGKRSLAFSVVRQFPSRALVENQ